MALRPQRVTLERDKVGSVRERDIKRSEGSGGEERVERGIRSKEGESRGKGEGMWKGREEKRE